MVNGVLGNDREKVPLPDNFALLEEVEKHRGNPLMTFYLSDTIYINDECVLPIFEQLRQITKPKGKALDLFLYSRGGTTETPWKIVSVIHEFFPTYNVLIPYRAHSAATHISLGAGELVMGPMSEISPVDPTRMHPLLPKGTDGNPIPISVQDLKHCISFLRNEAGDVYTADAVAEIYTTLFQYINPLALGAIEQSYRLARLISQKILTSNLGSEHTEHIEKIVNVLSADYQSHAYPISREEVCTDLGLNAVRPSNDLWETMWELYLYYREQSEMIYKEETSGVHTRHLGFVDSLDGRIVLRQNFEYVEDEKSEGYFENILSTQWIRL